MAACVWVLDLPSRYKYVENTSTPSVSMMSKRKLEPGWDASDAPFKLLLYLVGFVMDAVTSPSMITFQRGRSTSPSVQVFSAHLGTLYLSTGSSLFLLRSQSVGRQ
jgi:hypothetical protein